MFHIVNSGEFCLALGQKVSDLKEKKYSGKAVKNQMVERAFEGQDKDIA